MKHETPLSNGFVENVYIFVVGVLTNMIQNVIQILTQYLHPFYTSYIFKEKNTNTSSLKHLGHIFFD